MPVPQNNPKNSDFKLIKTTWLSSPNLMLIQPNVAELFHAQLQILMSLKVCRSHHLRTNQHFTAVFAKYFDPNQRNRLLAIAICYDNTVATQGWVFLKMPFAFLGGRCCQRVEVHTEPNTNERDVQLWQLHTTVFLLFGVFCKSSLQISYDSRTPQSVLPALMYSGSH